MEQDPEAHVKRVKERLAAGRQVIEAVQERGLVPYDIPGVKVNQNLATRSPPWSTDPYVCSFEFHAIQLAHVCTRIQVLCRDRRARSRSTGRHRIARRGVPDGLADDG